MTSRSTALAALLLSSIVLLSAQTTKKAPAAPSENTGAVIGKLEDEMRLAALKGTAGWWADHLDDAFLDTDFQGKVRTKAEVVDIFKSNRAIYETMNLSERTLHVFNGNTVIVTGRMNLEGTYQSQPLSGDFQVTRVWAKQGLVWMLVSSQATRIAAP